MDNPLRVSNYKQQFSKIKMARFDVTNGMRITDIPEIERPNPSLKISVYELAREIFLVPLSNFENNVDVRRIQVLF